MLSNIVPVMFLFFVTRPVFGVLNNKIARNITNRLKSTFLRIDRSKRVNEHEKKFYDY